MMTLRLFVFFCFAIAFVLSAGAPLSFLQVRKENGAAHTTAVYASHADAFEKAAFSEDGYQKAQPVNKGLPEAAHEAEQKYIAPEVEVGQAVVAKATENTLEREQQITKDGAGDSVCRVPAGRLLFLHIMKAGGTSVDKFLACHCRRVGCSVMLSLGPFREMHGREKCKRPAMCTTHGEYRNRKELCGEDFEHPHKVMTVFREPVSRVFSLYNYEKAQGRNLPSIAELYQICDAKQGEQISDDLHGHGHARTLSFMCQGMVNHMAFTIFADKDFGYPSTWDAALLNQSKLAVSRLDAIWFLEDLERLPTTFGKAGLVDNGYIDEDKPRCELDHSNPTACPNCTDEPTESELELIRKHNEMDIALYNFAATLPNRKGQINGIVDENSPEGSRDENQGFKELVAAATSILADPMPKDASRGIETARTHGFTETAVKIKKQSAFQLIHADDEIIKVHPSNRSKAAHAPSLLSDNSELEDGDSECRVAAGQLLFLHIMKAGGTSIDKFLACHCKRVGCSMVLSLGPFREIHGNTRCVSPAMCTTHGNYRNRRELCGEDFEHPSKVITAFREPISRVFSLYNYQKAHGRNLSSIADVYQRCDAGVDEGTPIGFMCRGMTNHMVLKTFADKDLDYSSTWDEALLNQSKRVVSSLDAVWFLEDFDRLPDTFGEAELVSNNYINASKPRCEVDHSNPTKCPTCADEPTPEEIELIRKHNTMDIALYNFAATLPNRKGHVATAGGAFATNKLD